MYTHKTTIQHVYTKKNTKCVSNVMIICNWKKIHRR